MAIPTWQLENAKQRHLEWLYKMDGREKPEHQMHGVYTGLFQARLQELAMRERMQFVR